MHPPAITLPFTRALVTGGAGFVGHGVVAALHASSVDVVVLDPGRPHPTWPPGVHHLRGDVRDPEAIRRAADGCGMIFHVAGVWDGGPDGEDRMRSINVGGTEAVLSVGLPVVYTSSSITCGFGTMEQPGAEDDPSEDSANPIRGTGAVYRQTKLAAEALVIEAGGYIVNPDYVIGAGDVHGVVTGPLLAAARLPVILAPRGGKCFVGVHDVGLGHLLVLRGQPGRRYLLGAENLTYAAVFAQVAAAMGRSPRILPLPRTLPRAFRRLPRIGGTMGAVEQMGLPRYRSHARAAVELGYSPQPVAAAIAEMVAFSGGG
ncbi:MAG: dihydroflavonol-4-reductase [Myxococcota bacterium]|jgi:dihydroflavonol-4-reductase